MTGSGKTSCLLFIALYRSRGRYSTASWSLLLTYTSQTMMVLILDCAKMKSELRWRRLWAVALADMANFAPSVLHIFLPALTLISAPTILISSANFGSEVLSCIDTHSGSDELNGRRYMHMTQKAHVDMAPPRSTQAERVCFFAYGQVTIYALETE